jgi:hypothetical protein
VKSGYKDKTFGQKVKKCLIKIRKYMIIVIEET